MSSRNVKRKKQNLWPQILVIGGKKFIFLIGVVKVLIITKKVLIKVNMYKLTSISYI